MRSAPRPRPVNASRWGVRIGAVGLVLMLTGPASAVEHVLPPQGDDLVGSPGIAVTAAEDTLSDIARRYDLGYDALRQANPGVDPWLPGAGTEVTLPTRFILPDAPREGIVLNVAEMRLYYYPRPARGRPARVVTHPVSIGRAEWHTPLTATRVVRKVANPSWYPPKSIRAEHAAMGEILPERVPPGPDNPLGRYSLRLGLAGYLIHGTNKPYGIGMRVTHGCVRLYPEDIAALYEQVPVGTRVRIVNQPIRSTWHDGVLYLAVHPPFADDENPPPIDTTAAVRSLIAATPSERMHLVDWDRVNAVMEAQRGMPAPVSRKTTRTEVRRAAP